MYSEDWIRKLGLTTETSDLVARLPVCFLVRVCRFVLIWLYWLYFERTSVSMEDASCSYVSMSSLFPKQCDPPRGLQTRCNRSINSPRGLSARYLTLFQEKVRRY